MMMKIHPYILKIVTPALIVLTGLQSCEEELNPFVPDIETVFHSKFPGSELK
jgi:hypothetical protein